MSHRSQTPHPNSPAGGGGPGGFRTAGSLGIDTGHSAAPGSSHSTEITILNVRVVHNTGAQSAWTAPPPPSGHPVVSILGASSWDALKLYAEITLGPASFHLGLCVGMTENLASGAGSLLSLLKTFILEGVYERVHHPPKWWEPDLWSQYAVARAAELAVGDPELLKAHNQCVALLEELRRIVHHPKTFFKKLGKKYEDEYARKWAGFKVQLGLRTLGGYFQAGRVTGQVLLDVILMVLAVYGAAEVAAKLATEIPELLNVVRGFKGGEEILRVEKVAGGVQDTEKLSAPIKAPRDPDLPLKDKSPITKPDLQAFTVTNDGIVLKVDRIRVGTRDKLCVIGRNMDDVRPYAQALQKQGYNVEIFDPPLVSAEAQAEWTQAANEAKAQGRRLTSEEVTKTKMFKENQAWAEKLNEDGSTVVDIDNPRNAGPSQFYKLEGTTLFGDKP